MRSAFASRIVGQSLRKTIKHHPYPMRLPGILVHHEPHLPFELHAFRQDRDQVRLQARHVFMAGGDADPHPHRCDLSTDMAGPEAKVFALQLCSPATLRLKERKVSIEAYEPMVRKVRRCFRRPGAFNACGTRSYAIAFATRPRGDRTNRLTPSSSSSLSICRPTVGCAKPSCLAALERLPSRMTARNVRYKSQVASKSAMQQRISVPTDYPISFSSRGWRSAGRYLDPWPGMAAPTPRLGPRTPAAI